MRKSGIEFVGGVPWGTRFCQFYQTKQDLIDILVPYFAEGLRNNEFCVWVAFEPLRVDEAQEAMQRHLAPHFDRILRKDRGAEEGRPDSDHFGEERQND